MKAKQTFSILAQSALSSDEWKVLGLLYQPLMGTLAFSMYHTFYHLLNQKNYQSEVFTHQFLSDMLNEKYDKLKEAKEKLEALNLLSTFQDQEHFIYKLKTPLTPRGFFKDTVLGQFLQTEVGGKMFDQLTNLFKVQKVELENYQEITKNFDDVFNFVASNDYVDTAMYLGKRSNTGVKIQEQINYDTFVERLPDRVKKPILIRHDTKEAVQKLIFIYQLSMDEMAEIYLNTVQPNGNIDLGQLNFKAQQYYIDKKSDIPVVQEKKELNGNGQLLHYLKTQSPLRIVEVYAKGDYQLMATETVMQLMDRNQVEVGVINALLLHILKHKEGELPHITYLEKVLETWLKKGIRTTEDAYNTVLNNQVPEQTTKSGSKQVKKDNNTPEWVNDYLKELKEKEEREGA